MRALLLSLVILLPAPALAQSRSPSGHYRLEVDRDYSGAASTALRVVDLRTGHVTAIDPNPGGIAPPNMRARFTAGDNVLASWGCGTYCTVAVLFSPSGAQIASFGAYDVSPDGARAITFDPFDSPSFADGEVQIVDLRTGAIVQTESNVPEWNVCSVRWAPGHATLVACDTRTRAHQVTLR